MRTTIVGTGYVGLVTGACLADLDNEVVCLDSDRRKVALLREGRIPIHEAGLAEIVERNVASKRLSFTTDAEAALGHGDILFIAVGTPAGRSGAAAVEGVLDVARTIGRLLDRFKVVAIKSTVPVGTAAQVQAVIQSELDARGSKAGFAVVSNPEFLKEGVAVDDFMRPDRIVIGCDDDEVSRQAASLMDDLYAPLVRDRVCVLHMSRRAAEFTKYAANAMLATRISFMNEMACLAEALGVDIEAVRGGIGTDRRIGSSFLRAGCGYGGACLPKDVQALLHSAAEHGCRMPILEAVEQVNRRQKHLLVEKILGRFGPHLAGRHFALWGLAFKPDTDDMRDAPSRVLVSSLLERGASVAVHDPVAMQEARRVFGHELSAAGDRVRRLRFADRPLDALQEADALVIVTEWQAFHNPDLIQMKRALKAPIIFDGRNLYSPGLMREAGFEYYAIGRSTHSLPCS